MMPSSIKCHQVKVSLEACKAAVAVEQSDNPHSRVAKQTWELLNTMVLDTGWIGPLLVARIP